MNILSTNSIKHTCFLFHFKSFFFIFKYIFIVIFIFTISPYGAGQLEIPKQIKAIFCLEWVEVWEKKEFKDFFLKKGKMKAKVTVESRPTLIAFCGEIFSLLQHQTYQACIDMTTATWTPFKTWNAVSLLYFDIVRSNATFILSKSLGNTVDGLQTLTTYHISNVKQTRKEKQRDQGSYTQ